MPFANTKMSRNKKENIRNINFQRMKDIIIHLMFSVIFLLHLYIIKIRSVRNLVWNDFKVKIHLIQK